MLQRISKESSKYVLEIVKIKKKKSFSFGLCFRLPLSFLHACSNGSARALSQEMHVVEPRHTHALLVGWCLSARPPALEFTFAFRTLF